tara:strand:- start:1797 stop:1940 length:144 start_codon:yes stop_codon:yes gene_type:complete
MKNGSALEIIFLQSVQVFATLGKLHLNPESTSWEPHILFYADFYRPK